jgi:hypothetical protein
MKDAYIIGDIVTFDKRIACVITGFTTNTLHIIKNEPFNIINNKTRDVNIKQFIGKRYCDLGVMNIPIKEFFNIENYANYKFL